MLPRLIAMHEPELFPGIRAEDFERFVTQSYIPAHASLGINVQLLRGDRGERDGQFLLVYEFESVERRNNLFPANGLSDQMERWTRTNAALITAWKSMASWPSARYTDYVPVGARANAIDAQNEGADLAHRPDDVEEPEPVLEPAIYED
jgi:hypothetical protein